VQHKILLKKWENFCAALSIPSKPECVILGASRTGCSLLTFLSQLPINITVADTDQEKIDVCRQLKSMNGCEATISFESGEHKIDSLLASDCIFISPGIPRRLPIIQEAIKRTIPVINDIELISHLYTGTIIAITGSNGKSTVSDAMGKLLEDAGKSVLVAGNIGRPVFDEFSAIATRPDYLVLELSSFQLESIVSFAPEFAVILNLSPDHLDRYDDLTGYYEAKMSITRNQAKNGWLIINGDDIWLKEQKENVLSHIISFSQRRKVSQGASLIDNTIFTIFGERESESSFPLSLDKMHRENVLALITLGLTVGLDLVQILATLDNYPGLSHRFETVARINNRLFINDSKATNVGSVAAALKTLNGKCHLIMGGRDKGANFDELIPLLLENVKKIYSIGESAEILMTVFEKLIPISQCSSLNEAVMNAFSNSDSGETIILSPGCASFDMFRDFEDRGSQFREIVAQLEQNL